MLRAILNISSLSLNIESKSACILFLRANGESRGVLRILDSCLNFTTYFDSYDLKILKLEHNFRNNQNLSSLSPTSVSSSRSTKSMVSSAH